MMALLAALCLALQPMLHGAAMAAMQAIGDFILVCSADGARLLPVPGGALPGDLPIHAHKAGCADCMPAAGMGLLSVGPRLATPATWTDWLVARPAQRAASRHRRAAGARAPPA